MGQYGMPHVCYCVDAWHVSTDHICRHELPRMSGQAPPHHKANSWPSICCQIAQQSTQSLSSGLIRLVMQFRWMLPPRHSGRPSSPQHFNSFFFSFFQFLSFLICEVSPVPLFWPPVWPLRTRGHLPLKLLTLVTHRTSEGRGPR